MKSRNGRGGLSSWAINRPIGTVMLTVDAARARPRVRRPHSGRHAPAHRLPERERARRQPRRRAGGARGDDREAARVGAREHREPREDQRRHLRGVRQRSHGVQVRHERRLRRPGRRQERRARSRPAARGSRSADRRRRTTRRSSRSSPVAFSSQQRDQVALREWVDQRLRPQLLSVPGVAALDLNGGLVREIQVELEPTRLRGYGLSVSQVINALRNENQDVAAGRITATDREMVGKTAGKFHSLDDIRGDSAADVRAARACRCPKSRSFATRARNSAAGGVSTASRRCASRSASSRKRTRSKSPTACARASRSCKRARFVPKDIKYVVTYDQSGFIQRRAQLRDGSGAHRRVPRDAGRAAVPPVAPEDAHRRRCRSRWPCWRRSSRWAWATSRSTSCRSAASR